MRRDSCVVRLACTRHGTRKTCRADTAAASRDSKQRIGYPRSENQAEASLEGRKSRPGGTRRTEALFVRMPMVDVREMRMPMPHRRMDMRMAVRFGAVPFERVGV